MFTISCTKKLFDLSGWAEEPIPDGSAEDLYKWHANVFRLARKNNLIIMNNQTRYSMVLLGIKKEHLKNFQPLFVQCLRENLSAEGIPEADINEYIRKAVGMTFTKTYDRSVIGSMVDMVKMTEYIVGRYWPIEAMNIIDLNLDNNKTPIVKLKDFPNTMMREALAFKG